MIFREKNAKTQKDWMGWETEDFTGKEKIVQQVSHIHCLAPVVVVNQENEGISNSLLIPCPQDPSQIPAFE